MVIDTSAVIAFLLNEPEAERVQAALATEGRRVMSAVNFLETQLVPAAALGPTRRSDLSG